jgi:hypothetical protein
MLPHLDEHNTLAAASCHAKRKHRSATVIASVFDLRGFPSIEIDSINCP